MADRVILSLEDRYEVEAEIRRRVGCSLQDLMRTALRMWRAGEIEITAADVDRHNGGRAGAESL